MLSRLVQSRVADEDGSILVIAAIAILAVAMLGGFVVQVGDWFQHRRSAQVRADAAALAGGQLFGQCFDTANFTPAQAATNMHEMAKHYSGYASNVPGTPFNPQFGGGATTQPLFASKTYPDGGGGGADDTNTSNECTSMQLDVKLQDSNIPPLFGWFPHASIHAHARVEMKQIRSFKGSFPLAIPEVEPKFVTATFVDEATGNELTGCGATGLLTGTTCTYPLTKGASANSLTAYTASLTPNFPAVVANAGKRVGVRIGMGSVRGTCANTAGNDNWACFDGGTNARGALMLRDYAAGSGGAAQPAKPILRAVYPSNSCSPAFAPSFGTSPFVSDAGGATTCSVGVSARIDFGTGATDPTKAQAAGGVKAIVTATINGSTLNLSPSPGSYDPGTTTWLWTVTSGSATVPVNDAGTTSGYPVTLTWEEQDGTVAGDNCKTGNGNKCTDDFDGGGAAVARITSATSDDEGPIKLMKVTDAGGASAYSFTPGLQTVNLEIQIEGSLSVVNPPVLQALRLTHTGSRTTAIECDASGNNAFTDAIRTGCKTPYQINSSQICPDPSPPAGPADCVPTKTGNLGQTVTKALDDRFAGCPPDRWAQYGASYPGDPRVIVMMLTDFSAYSAQGKTTVPVVNFAAFYVVGWSGNKCGAAWPFPGGEPSGGNIWGYFVKYAALNQVPNGLTCDPNQITPCVPVLVR